MLLRSQKKYSSDQVKMRLISQLINGISRVLQKLLKCFNATAISTSFVLPAVGIFPVILTLNLNHSDCVILTFGSSLQYCHKLSDVFEYLLLYIIKLYIGITRSIYFALSVWVLFISLMQSVNGADFLNINPLFLSSNRLLHRLHHILLQQLL